MKVGVITFSESKDNYGQLLQCYAMQEYLRKRGYEPFLIRYHDTPMADTTGFKPAKMLTYMKNLPKYVKWYLDKRKASNDNMSYLQSVDFDKRDFSGFLTRHIQCSPVYDKNTIHQHPPIADAFVCGSDQIWAGEDAYYLSFAPDETLKIAYAPSLGGLTTFSEEKEKRMSFLIHRLDKVGMREQSGVDTCNRLGRTDAVKVVDPTLLLDRSDYDRIAIPSKRERPYALVYLLGNPIDVSVEDIFKINSRKGLDTVYISSQGRSDKMPNTNPTIEEWLGLIAGADTVVTNSFHCTVFALQFHRDFNAIPLSRGYERMNTRIDELLTECGLERKFTINLLKTNKLGEKDFVKFEEYKIIQQDFSRDFLSL